MSRPRDSQRGKVWDAIHAVFGQVKDYEPKEMWEVQEYVEEVLTTSRDHLTNLPRFTGWEYKDGRGRQYMGIDWDEYDQPIVIAPRNQREDWRLLLLIAYHSIDDDQAWHGWQFCFNYLWLVKRFLGQQQGAQLREAFKTHKVRYHKPSKRTMTDEQREAARQRMQRLHLRRELRSGEWDLGERLEKMLDD